MHRVTHALDMLLYFLVTRRKASTATNAQCNKKQTSAVEETDNRMLHEQSALHTEALFNYCQPPKQAD
jgi:hypothetical protein